jgi:HlyD family secretion protein
MDRGRLARNNQTNMKKKKLLPILFLAVICFGAFYGTKTFLSYRQDQRQLTLYGNVDIKEVSASFRVAGRLKKLYFDEGDLVKEGDLLAELESDTYSNELDLARANVEAARASLNNSENKFQRAEKLFRNKLISKQEFEDEKFAYEQIKSQFDAKEAQLKIAQTAFDDTRLLAPSDAYVMTRAFEIGSMLAQNQTVYELSLTNQIYVRAYVDEKDLGKIANGTTVKIQTDGGDKFEGQVGFISPKAEFTPKSVETTSLRTQLVYRLRIAVKNSNTNLKQGMPVTVVIERK